MGGFKKFDKSRGDSRGGRSFGGSKFGGGRKFSGRGDDRGDGPKQLFDAVCTECDRDCQVPFRPSSGNPVFCSNCFKKQGDDRGNFASRKSFNTDRAGGRSFGKDAGTSHGITQAQFDVLSMKLDKVISLLKNTAEFDDDIDFVEKKSKKFLGPTATPIQKTRGKRK